MSKQYSRVGVVLSGLQLKDHFLNGFVTVSYGKEEVLCTF